MSKCHIIVIFCLFISNISFSQDYYNKDLERYIDSIIKQDTVSKTSQLQIRNHLSKFDTINYGNDLGIAYHELGKFFYRKQDVDLAIDFTTRAVHFKRRVKDTFETHRSLNNLYFFYDSITKKLATLEKIISNKTYDKYSLRAHVKAATILLDKGDYHKALEYFFYIINSFEKNHLNTEQLIMAHLGCIEVYLKMKIQADEFYKVEYHNTEIEKNIKNVKNKEKKLAVKNNNLAIIYSNIKRHDEAILFYKKALQSFIEEKDSIKAGHVYNNLGEIYSELKNKSKALSYFNKATQITNDEYVLSSVFHNKGFYLDTDNPIDKIPYYQKSIASLLGSNYQEEILNNLPTLKAIKKPEYAVEILEDLIQIANTWVFEFNKNGNSQNLLHAKNTVDLVDELISYIRFESSIDQSKLFWINKGVDTYMLGVKISYLLKDVESALFFMEKNKALLLLENLNTNETNKLFISSLESIKNEHVSKTSNFVEYILNDKEGYGIFLSNSTSAFFKIKNTADLLKKVSRFKNQCQKPFSNKSDGIEFANNAYFIFKRLFPFKNALQHISKKQLTIVSDYEIKTFPFEALVSSVSSKNLKNNFLINKAEISYLYSASVLTQIQKKNHNAKQSVLGIAPQNFSIDTLTTLGQSVYDMDVIASYFSTTLLTKKEATRSKVLSVINDYKIIHFNTHAGLDEKTQEPWLALNDEKIYLQELYNVPNQADLVVLDACKSASGKLEVGEGVMSLSRGFTHNGAKSVIASQWNANEKAISGIFQTFYSELSQGKSKSRALHNAKLKYLKAHELSEISPYYWASMTLTGDANSITIDSKTSYKWLLLLFVVILLFVYFIYSKR